MWGEERPIAARRESSGEHEKERTLMGRKEMEGKKGEADAQNEREMEEKSKGGDKK